MSSGISSSYFPYDVFLIHDVFHSRSAKDKAVVHPLAERMRKDGLKVWFDEKAGARMDGAKRRSTSELQPSAFDLQPFLGAPLNKECRFIPLRLNDAPIKGSLAQFLYIK